MSDNNKKTPAQNLNDALSGRFGFIDISAEVAGTNPAYVLALFNALDFAPIETEEVYKDSSASFHIRYFGLSKLFKQFEPDSKKFPIYYLDSITDDDIILKTYQMKTRKKDVLLAPGFVGDIAVKAHYESLVNSAQGEPR